MKVIVVGGGLLGAPVAWRLAQAGAKVTLLEASGLGSGASQASFAWISSSTTTNHDYYRLKMDAVAEYRALEREFGPQSWLHLDGHIEWNAAADGAAQTRGYDGHVEPTTAGTGADHLRDKALRLREWGYTVELLPVRELRHLEPDLVPPDSLQEFVFYPDEGYIHPVDAIGTFAAHARSHGVTLREGTTVAGLLREGDRVTGVITATGERLEADVVVSCAGSWTGELLRMAGIDFPMAPRVGMVAISAPTAVRLRSVLHHESLSLRPDGAGRIMMRNYDFDEMTAADTSPDARPAYLDDLFARAVQVLPGLASSRIETMRVGVRPIPADNLPHAGFVPGVDGLYLLVCHGGAILGPLLGRLAAMEMVRGEADPRLASFRPGRS